METAGHFMFSRFATRAAERSVYIFALLLLFSVLVRLPFFFPADVDWDESTWILIGQSMLDGHLPYVYLWDIKPPLLFGFFSIAIAVFGHSVAGIRFAGAMCVATTAFLVYRIAAGWWNRSTALLAAGLSILLSSLLSSGQATMSEHVMLPFLMSAAYVWIVGTDSLGRSFWVGVLMGAATLVRLNMAVGVLAVGMLILTQAARYRAGAIRHLAAYAAGGLILVALTCLPFLVAGQLMTLWRSTVATLAYSTSENSIMSNVVYLGMSTFGAGPRGYLVPADALWLSGFVWLGAPAGLVVIWCYRQTIRAPERRGITSLSLLAAATGVSIAMSGGANPHYLIQLVPFVSIFSAVLVYYPPRALRVLTWALVAALTFMSARPVVAEYGTLLARVRTHRHLGYGRAYDIAEYLKRENPSGRPVFLMTDHLAYWLTNSYPPTIVTQPSMLAREYALRIMGTTTQQEVMKIFRQAPEFVVMETDDWLLDGASRRLLESILADDYVAVAAGIQGVDVYRKRLPR